MNEASLPRWTHASARLATSAHSSAPCGTNARSSDRPGSVCSTLSLPLSLCMAVQQHSLHYRRNQIQSFVMTVSRTFLAYCERRDTQQCRSWPRRLCFVGHTECMKYKDVQKKYLVCAPEHSKQAAGIWHLRRSNGDKESQDGDGGGKTLRGRQKSSNKG